MHIHELMAKLTMVESEFKTKHGCAPSQPQLASLVGITTEKLQMLLKVRTASHNYLAATTSVSSRMYSCFRSCNAFHVRLAAAPYCFHHAFCKVPDNACL